MSLRLEEKLTKIKEKVIHPSRINSLNRALTHGTVLLILAPVKQLSRENSSVSLRETDYKKEGDLNDELD